MTADESVAVTVFLRNGGHVLLCRRPDTAAHDPERWDVLTSPVGETEEPETVATRVVEQATTLDSDDVERVRKGSRILVEDDAGDRAVIPFLFDCAERTVERLEGVGGVPTSDTCEWVQPTEILRRDAVTGLWRAYERVAPSVRSVSADDEHGSAWISLRALEVIRDRAGVLRAEGASLAETWDELGALARHLRTVRPSIAVLENRVNRLMATTDRDPSSLERSAMDAVNRAVRVDAEAADRAGSLVSDRAVLTLSRSGTVLRALGEATPTEVFVAESRPAREGVGVATELLADAPVTLHTDAAIGHVLATEAVDCVLVGADAVLPDGRIVNKTGTRLAAVAAAHEEVPCFVACASDKIRGDDTLALESGPRSAVYEGDASLGVANPTFDVTPPHLVDAIVTERGELDPRDVRPIAEEHASLTGWDADLESGIRGDAGEDQVPR